LPAGRLRTPSHESTGERERILGTCLFEVKRKWIQWRRQTQSFQQVTDWATFAPYAAAGPRGTFCTISVEQYEQRMPTPFGHAVGGLAAAFLVNSTAKRPRLTMPILAASAVLAMTPDLDIIAGLHRLYTHSIAAVAVVGIVSWLVLRRRTTDAVPLTAVLAAAYGSHAVLDLLGKDTSAPLGLTALWPLSSAYYLTGWDIFAEVSRRYWRPEEFILGNLRALAREMLVLVPILLAVWALWSKRTLARTQN
jgi:inner membrane protein